jgi:hypothetical protein
LKSKHIQSSAVMTLMSMHLLLCINMFTCMLSLLLVTLFLLSTGHKSFCPRVKFIAILLQTMTLVFLEFLVCSTPVQSTFVYALLFMCVVLNSVLSPVGSLDLRSSSAN